MAVALNPLQVTWDAGALTDSIASGANSTSDAMALSATCFAAGILCKANNAGTPGSGDTVDFYLLASTGDPDAAEGTDEYASVTGIWLCQCDTSSINPNLQYVPLPSAAMKGFKIYAVNNSAADSMTISAQVSEKTA